MRHMLLPVGGEARVRERGDIEGSYPSFCYSTADPFAALVRELAVPSTGKEQRTTAWFLWKRKSSPQWCKKYCSKESMQKIGELNVIISAQ